jgi:hypothetical protein
MPLVLAAFLLMAPGASAASSGELSVRGGSSPLIVIDAPVPAALGFALVRTSADGRCYRWSGQAIVRSNVTYDLMATLSVPADATGWLRLQRPSGPGCAAEAAAIVPRTGGGIVLPSQDPSAARATDVAVDILLEPGADVAATLAEVRLAIGASAAL